MRALLARASDAASKCFPVSYTAARRDRALCHNQTWHHDSITLKRIGASAVELLSGFSESELHANDAVVPDTSVVPPPCRCFQSAGVTSVAEIENPHATIGRTEHRSPAAAPARVLLAGYDPVL